MAAVVKCESCGKVIEPKDAMHIRAYRMSSATTYYSGDPKLMADVCKDCYTKVRHMLNRETKQC